MNLWKSLCGGLQKVKDGKCSSRLDPFPPYVPRLQPVAACEGVLLRAEPVVRRGRGGALALAGGRKAEGFIVGRGKGLKG